MASEALCEALCEALGDARAIDRGVNARIHYQTCLLAGEDAGLRSHWRLRMSLWWACNRERSQRIGV